MNPKYAKDFFAINRLFIRCAGLWKPDTTSKKIKSLYEVYWIIIFFYVYVWFLPTEFVSFFYTYKDKNKFIKNLSLFLSHLMGSAKVLLWYLFQEDLIGMMETLEDPKLHYEDFMMYYQPGRILHKYKKIGIKYSVMFLSFAFATVSSSYMPLTIAAIRYTWACGFDYCSDINVNLTLPTSMPYHSWMPFNYDTGPTFILAVIYQEGWQLVNLEVPLFLYIFSIVGMDTLYVNIMNCVVGNLKIIQGALLFLRERCIKRLGLKEANNTDLQESDIVMAEMSGELKKVINHLQVAYEVCDKLEIFFRYVVLGQVAASLFLLCTCLYLLATVPMISKNFITECCYLATILLQLLMYCWFSNEVQSKFEDTSSYIYNCNWFATDRTFKNDMIITMMRARRPVYFTAGKFAPLLLPTFVSVAKASYTVFALIKT